MNLRVFLVPTIAFASLAHADPLDDPERRMDKYAHFGISTSITAAFQTIGKGFHRTHRVSDENRSISSTLALTIGAIKEYRDLHAGAKLNESRQDMAADTLGVILGNLIHWEF